MQKWCVGWPRVGLSCLPLPPLTPKSSSSGWKTPSFLASSDLLTCCSVPTAKPRNAEATFLMCLGLGFLGELDPTLPPGPRSSQGQAGFGSRGGNLFRSGSWRRKEPSSPVATGFGAEGALVRYGKNRHLRRNGVTNSWRSKRARRSISFWFVQLARTLPQRTVVAKHAG